MRLTRMLLGVFAAVLAGPALSAQAPVSEIDAHIAAAKAAAGLDYRATFVNLCLPGANPALANPAAGRAGGAGAAGERGARGGGGRGAGATPDRATWYASPYKVFDNFYWLGTRQHSSWALRTSDGLIIIDTNFAWATQPEIIDGLKTLGLDPRRHQIRPHQPRARRSRPGRRGTAETIRREGGDGRGRLGRRRCSGPRPPRAACRRATSPSVRDGMKLTLGDTTVDIVPTPGHTPGTLSYVFPVKDQGRTLMVAYSGGTLTGAFGTNGARWDEYIDSQKRIAKAAADAGAAVIVSNHSEYDNAYTKARLIARQARSRREPSVRRRCRRRAALFHGDDRMRDGVEAEGRSEVVSGQQQEVDSGSTDR